MRNKKTNRMIKPPLQRFIDNVKINKNGCWEWQGYKNKAGYGVLGNGKNKTELAHRYFYKHYIGDEIPQGLQVLHKCDNPACIYPKHLFLGTDKDNVKDKISKNRQACVKGNKNPKSKLTEKDVLDIRASYIPMKVSFAALGRKYNVTPENISSIIHRETWKHV